jgi:autotransporter-associated beta strand protein
MTYIAGQTNYIEAYIPNTTVYSSQVNWYGNGYGQAGVVTPTWQSIYDGLLTDSAVNISIWGGDNHCLSVTGFHWTDYQQDGIIDASDNATIDVVDPYTGLNETFSIWQDSANGMLHMADVLSPDSQIMSVMVTTPAQWNGQGSANWSSTSSWLGSVPNGPGAMANFLNFATGATTVTLDSSQTVGALNFDSPYGYSLVAAGSSTLTLSQPGGAATITVTNVFGNGAHTIAAPLVLASPLVVTQNSSSPLTITGPISDGGNGYSLTMNGPGSLILGGSNTYSGGTIINGGMLTLDFSLSGAPASNILPSGGPLTVGGGSLTVVGNPGSAAVQTIGALTFNGGTSAIALNANGATSLALVATGAFTVNGAATITAGANTSLSIGNTWIQGSGGSLLINLAGGALTSNPTCTVNGLIGAWVTVNDANGLGLGVVSGGNVVSSAGGPVLPPTGADIATNYTLGGGTSSQTVTASQTANSLTITPAATGQILTINSGQTLGLTANAIFFNGGNYPYTVNGPGQLGGSDSPLTLYATGGNALTLGAPLGGGSGSLTILGSGTVILTAANSYSGPTTCFAGATLQLGDGIAANGSVAGDLVANGSLVFANPAAQTYSGTISGAGSMTMSGPGLLTLGGSNTCLGGTYLGGGTLQLGNVGALGSGPGGLTIGAGVFDLAGYSPTLPSLAGSGGTVVNSGTVAAVLTVAQSTATVFSGTLQDGPGGTLALVKAGGGMLTLAGANTFSGGTTIAGGTLQVVDGGVLPGNVLNNACLLFSLSGASMFAGNASGAGGLIQSGSGTLVVSGSNTYGGGTFIQGGVVALGSPNSLPTAGVVTLGSADTNGTLDLAGFDQQIGGLALGSGANSAAQIVGNSSTVQCSTLTFGSGTSTFAGIIQDSLGNGNQKVGLVVSGGQLTLTGRSTYSGPTTITGGTLNAATWYVLPPQSPISIDGGQLIAAGVIQNVGPLTVGSGGALDLNLGTIISCNGPANLNGSLNLFGSTSGTQELIGCASLAGSFSNVSGVPYGYAIAYNPNEVDLAYAANDSVLSVSTSSVSLGRVMFNNIPAASVTITNGGTLPTGASVSASSGVTVLPGNFDPGSISASGSAGIVLGLAASATGSYSGTVQVLNSGDGGFGGGPSSAGPGLGSAQSPIIINVSGTLVAPRVVTASAVDLGRFMANQTVGSTSTLSTSGDDSSYTRVTVNGTLFNSATSSSSYNLSLSGLAPGPVNGSVTLPVVGEGLPGEGTYAGVIVSYSGESLLDRIVTSTSVNFGLVHVGQLIGQPITLSTTGLDDQYTRVSVNNAGPDGNGFAVIGGTNPLFNGPAVTDSRTLSGTPTVAGFINGTILLATNGEGLSGESPVPVQVNYSAQVFSGNAQWSGASGITSWAVNANWNDTVAAGIQAAPGVWGVTGDSATLGAGPACTITLDGASPSLGSLCFDNSSASYTLAAGSGGTLQLDNGPGTASLTVAAGSHTIAAPMILNSLTQVAVLQPGDALAISGAIGGSGGLTVTGAGMLTLTNSNSYSGGTTVSAGTLQLGSNNALGTGGLTINGGLVDLAGCNPVVASLAGTGGAILNSGSSVSTLTVNQSAASTFGGTLADGAGGLALAMNGPGLLCLAGSNSYSGGTIVTAGTLQLGNDAALGAGGLTVNGGLVDLAGCNPVLAGLSGAGGTIFNSGSNGSTLTVNQSTATIFGGTLTNSSGGLALVLNGAGLLTLAGSSACDSLSILGGTLACNGALNVNGSVCLGGTGSASTGNGQLTVNYGGTLSVGGTLDNSSGSVNLNGGTIRAFAFGGLPLTFNAGTLEYTGDLTISAADWLSSTLGSEHPLGAAQQLKVDGTTTLNNVLTLNGGTFSTGSLVNPGMLQFNSGTLNITGDNLSISGSGLFSNTLTLAAGAAVNVTNSASIAAGASLAMQGGIFSAATLTNSGTIGGSGQIAAPLTNAPGGQICAFTGDHPVFTGGSNLNQGQIQLSGGTVEFSGPLTNTSAGLIEGNGSLIVGGELLNWGAMTLWGTSSISGTVHNGQNASINITGGTTTFQGSVVNNGTISTATGGFSVFCGVVSGDGSFSGPGTPLFVGTLSPGHSPGTITFTGDAYFAETSAMNIELAGTTPGTQYDQVIVAGNVTLAGGSLNVMLLNGFRPAHNEQFTVLSFGSRSGDFAAETGLDLGNRLQLVPAYSGNSLVLTAVQGGSGTWQVDSDGNASVSANWSGGLPSAAGDTATFGPVISQPRTVTIDQPTTWGNVVLDSSLGYTLSGSNTLTLDNSGSGAAITLTGGQHAITAPLVLADNLMVQSGGSGSPWTLALGGSNGITETGSSRSLTMNGPGGILILSGVNTFSGGTTVAAGTLVVTSSTALPNDSSLTVDAGGIFVFDPSAATTADSSDNAGLTSTAGGVQICDAADLQPSLLQYAHVGEVVVIAVPEPGTFTLLLIAGLSVFLARRRIAERDSRAVL